LVALLVLASAHGWCIGCAQRTVPYGAKDRYMPHACWLCSWRWSYCNLKRTDVTLACVRGVRDPEMS